MAFMTGLAVSLVLSAFRRTSHFLRKRISQPIEHVVGEEEEHDRDRAEQEQPLQWPTGPAKKRIS